MTFISVFVSWKRFESLLSMLLFSVDIHRRSFVIVIVRRRERPARWTPVPPSVSVCIILRLTWRAKNIRTESVSRSANSQKAICYLIKRIIIPLIMKSCFVRSVFKNYILAFDHLWWNTLSFVPDIFLSGVSYYLITLFRMMEQGKSRRRRRSCKLLSSLLMSGRSGRTVRMPFCSTAFTRRGIQRRRHVI